MSVYEQTVAILQTQSQNLGVLVAEKEAPVNLDTEKAMNSNQNEHIEHHLIPIQDNHSSSKIEALPPRQLKTQQNIEIQLTRKEVEERKPNEAAQSIEHLETNIFEERNKQLFILNGNFAFQSENNESPKINNADFAQIDVEQNQNSISENREEINIQEVVSKENFIPIKAANSIMQSSKTVQSKLYSQNALINREKVGFTDQQNLVNAVQLNTDHQLESFQLQNDKIFIENPGNNKGGFTQKIAPPENDNYEQQKANKVHQIREQVIQQLKSNEMFVENKEPKAEKEDEKKQKVDDPEQEFRFQANHLSIQSTDKQKYRIHSEFVESIQEQKEKKEVEFIQFIPNQQLKSNAEIPINKQGQKRQAQIQNEHKLEVSNELNFSFSHHKQVREQVSNSQDKNNFNLKSEMQRPQRPNKKGVGKIAKKILHEKKIHDVIVDLQRYDDKKIVIPKLQENKKTIESGRVDLSKLDTHITLNSNILNLTIGDLVNKDENEATKLLDQIQELKKKLFSIQNSKRREVEDMEMENYYNSSSPIDQYASPDRPNYTKEYIDEEIRLSNKHNKRQNLGKFYRKVQYNNSKLSEQLLAAGITTQRRGPNLIESDPLISTSRQRFSSAEVFQGSNSDHKSRVAQSKSPILFRVRKNNKNSLALNLESDQKEIGFIKSKEIQVERDQCFQAKRQLLEKLQFTEEEKLNIIEKPAPRELRFEEDFISYVEKYFLDIGSDKPKRQWNQQELVEIAKLAFKKFGVNLQMEKQLILHVKKYKNCVSFILDNSKTVLWYYEGKFYYGGWIMNSLGEGEKSGWGYDYSPGKFVYSGHFKYNKRDGYGIMKFLTSDNDAIYEGNWKNGFKSGLGKQRQADQSIYIGQWMEGKKHGQGKLRISAAQTYEGTFINGIKHGAGNQMFKNGDQYFGSYAEGKFHGAGTYTWANFSKYEGQFREGLRNGYGVWFSDYRDPNSDRYEGQYSNDKKSGFGLYKWKDGTTYQGEFLNDLKHGEGVVSYGNGKSTKLDWFQGNIVSQQTSIDKQKSNNKQSAGKQNSEKSEQSRGSGSKPPLVKFNIKSSSKSKPVRPTLGVEQL